MAEIERRAGRDGRAAREGAVPGQDQGMPGRGHAHRAGARDRLAVEGVDPVVEDQRPVVQDVGSDRARGSARPELKGGARVDGGGPAEAVVAAEDFLAARNGQAAGAGDDAGELVLGLSEHQAVGAEGHRAAARQPPERLVAGGARDVEAAAVDADHDGGGNRTVTHERERHALADRGGTGVGVGAGQALMTALEVQSPVAGDHAREQAVGVGHQQIVAGRAQDHASAAGQAADGPAGRRG